VARRGVGLVSKRKPWVANGVGPAAMTGTSRSGLHLADVGGPMVCKRVLRDVFAVWLLNKASYLYGAVIFVPIRQLKYHIHIYLRA
jgi:hypothetical protein